MTFSLDPRLAADTYHLGNLPLCRVLLMNDARYPWVILVPRKPDLREFIDLDAATRHILMDEIALVSRAVQASVRPTKLNVAALGNVVAQLHIHIVARFEGDEAWPGPVWGKGERRPYDADAAQKLNLDLSRALNLV